MNTIDDLIQLFKVCIEKNASDLHIAVGRPPVLRIGGVLENMDFPELLPADMERLIYGVISEEQKDIIIKERELDFALSIRGVSRFRGNVHYQRGTLAASFRMLPMVIPSMEDLGVPVEVLTQLARRNSGLVLVTGPTGSGKSTTMASVIELINNERECHIITIEDPIEHVHNHQKALVEQREVHGDTLSFASALKHVLRQDPDVILVGEMRDLETFSATITAAETGHLVFSSLHTKDAIQTVDRIINVFPSHQHDQARVQLAGSLEGIICQRLLPHASENRLIIACEVMVATDAIRTLIREGKTHMIASTIESSSKDGMISMDRSLVDLFKKGMITEETLLRNCVKPKYIKGLITDKTLNYSN